MATVLGLFFAASAGICFLVASFISSYSLSGESPLAALYVEGFSKTSYETGLFFCIAAFTFLLYAHFPPFRETLLSTIRKSRSVYNRLPSYVQQVIIFCICLLIVSICNLSGVLYGYFHSDDFHVVAANTEHALPYLIALPQNGHAAPLYRVEVAVFYNLFGTNPVPYNMFQLVLAASTLFFFHLLLRKLKFGFLTSAVFILVLGTSVLLSDFLAGFYMLSMYLRILALFLASLLLYLAWSTATLRSHRVLFLGLSWICLTGATFVDIAGIWIPGAYVLFTLLHSIGFQGKTFLAYLRSHLAIGASVFATLALMVIYGWYTYLQTGYTPLSSGANNFNILSILKNLYDLLTAGIVAQLIVPGVGFLIDQPRFLHFLPLWHALMGISFLMFVFVVWYVLRRGDRQTRFFIVFCLALLLGTALLTAIQRPNIRPAAYFPTQQIIMPFYWFMCIVAIAIWTSVTNTSPETRRARTLALCAGIVCVFGAQHLYTFYNTQNVADVLESKKGVELLQHTLAPALAALASTSNEIIRVPDLQGNYINPSLPGTPASIYRPFLKLEPHIQFIPISSFIDSKNIHPSFIQALSQNSALHNIYLKSVVVVSDFSTTEKFDTEPLTYTSDGTTRIPLAFSSAHTPPLYITLDIEIPSGTEKTFIGISYEDSFASPQPQGLVRIDQFSPQTVSQAGRYVITVDLSQLYSYILSPYITDFSLVLLTPGTYRLYGYSLGT